ncbi:serine/threonine-protein kinase [Rubrivirga sp. IMCC45206]|uniref:serine/threonine-protein kinase n=1 Tax=Rubrivirga sp. IMCC45206 TaxID=3391614 RepID=UPI00398FF381
MARSPRPEVAPSRRLLSGPDAQAAAFFDRLMDGPLRLGADPPPPPSAVGGWAVRGKLGWGGASVVYQASRPTPAGPQRAALKLATRDVDGVRDQFAHEARMLRRLAPPIVPALLDVGVAADGRPYLALEPVDGQRSSDHARKLTPLQRLLLGWRLCRAVETLHDRGIVHADLKPEHLIVRPDGTVAVLDLGLARRPGREAPQGLGLTPEFAAPEQVLGEPVGFPADVYALGLLLFEVIGGARQRVPWALGDSGLDLPDPPEPGSAWAALDASLAAVLRTATDADPAHRYPSAGVLVRALDAVLDATAGA